MTKHRGACALTRAGGSLYTIKFKSARREPDLSISGLDPVSLSKIGTHLLASLGSKGKNRNSLACLRNAGFHSAESYCTTERKSRRRRDEKAPRALNYGSGEGGGVEKGRRRGGFLYKTDGGSNGPILVPI